MNITKYLLDKKENAFLFISRRHVEFQTAWGVIGQIFAVFTFETFAMVFCTKFGINGYPAMFIYVGVPIIAVILVIYSGRQMISSGYAHKYQKYGMDVNKDWRQTVEKVDQIYKLLEEKK